MPQVPQYYRQRPDYVQIRCCTSCNYAVTGFDTPIEDKRLLSLSSPFAVVLIVVPHMIIPKVELVLDDDESVPAAISRLRIVLLLAPFPAATLASQIAAVAADVFVFRTVKSRAVPVPPCLPSIVTLSAPFNFMIAPTIEPSIIRASADRPHRYIRERRRTNTTRIQSQRWPSPSCFHKPRLLSTRYEYPASIASNANFRVP